MTLILAIECSEGVLLASDGQSTIATSGQPTRAATDKVSCPWSNMAWGASGHVGIKQHVEEALRAAFGHADSLSKKTAYELRQAVRPVVARAVDVSLERSSAKGTPDASTSYLFAGLASDRPFILEIADNLTDIDHKSLGYAAIGSGEIFPYYALPSLAHFKVRERSMAEAKMLAYRVLQDAISVAAFGLGPPVQMIEILPVNGKAKARPLDEADLKILQDQVSMWKEIEADSLSQASGLSLAKVAGS